MKTPSNALRWFFVATVLLVPSAVSAQAVLSVSPTSLGAQAYVGQNAPSQTLQVSNAGNRALKWSVLAPSASWLSISPLNGVNTGKLTLTFQTSQLPAGQHQTSFIVQTNTGSRVTVSVQVSLAASTAPTLTVSCPANMTATSADGSPVAVTYSATASGGVAPIQVSGSPASGSAFPVGTTAVVVTSTSTDGQTARCGFSVTVTYTAPPPPPPPPSTGYGPQSTITCPSTAVSIWPGASIQTTIDMYPTNTTFCIRAGVHYLRSSITPKTGDTFVGEYGAILDGTGWSTTDGTQAAFRAHNQDIDYVTIRNLRIRNMPQRGIHAYYWMSDHWTIEYNEIASSGNTGMVIPHYTVIRNNYIHHNAFAGYMGQYVQNSTFESNEIAYNGDGQKVGETTNVTFRNNFVHHNVGAGIWYDTNNTGALIEGNRVEDNGWLGIFYEVSSDGIIRNNASRRNLAGVMLSVSKNVQIYNNTLEYNARGIIYHLNCPSLGGTTNFDLTNNTAHDNVITLGTESGALASALSYGNCTTTQVAPYLSGSKNLTFTRNTYRVPSVTGWYWVWGTSVKSWSEWQALGQDAEGINQ